MVSVGVFFASMAKNFIIGFLALALAFSVAWQFIRPVPPASHETTEVPPIPEPDPRLAAFDAILESAGSREGLVGAAIGFSFVGPEGELIYEHNGNIAQIPASSLKTLTTATALEVLGPDFCFETRLGVTASDDESGNGADLMLLGGGDPMLSLDDFSDWAVALVDAGVKSFPGRIIGDGRYFPGSPFADFWNWGDIGNGYGSPVSGLNVEHNRFTVSLLPGAEAGDPLVIEKVDPEVPGIFWVNESVTGEEGSGDGVVIHGGERTRVLYLRGTAPPGEEFAVKGAVPDPETFAAHHLRVALLNSGIEVVGEAIGAGELLLKGEEVPTLADELLLHRSPPLIDIVRSIHESSDNHETECLYKMLGIGSGAASAEVVREHWEARGLDLTGLRLVDGSGLGRADHITTNALARLQQLAATGPEGENYVGSLLKEMNGALHYKAGAMSAIRSITGLIETNSGGRHAFALIVNHYSDVAAVQGLQSDLLAAMAEW